MKMIIFTHAVACMCSALISRAVFCQALTATAEVNKTPATGTLVQNSALPANTAFVYRNAISVRAVRGFIKNFKYAKNVTWSILNGVGYTAQFKSDSIQTTVTFDRRGSINYIMREYKENHLAVSVREMVKNAFVNYTITKITEISTSWAVEDAIYHILISHAANFKILKINKMEMKIVREYTKL